MAGDVQESFLRLTESQSAEDVVAACEADPRLLDPAFEVFLTGFADELRAKGEDVDLVDAWRLVLRSVREGRNLYASLRELPGTVSVRAVRDLVLAEPLLLDPVVDALLLPVVRAARQQGHQELAGALAARRELLARFRAHGLVDGYFDVLVEQLAAVDVDGGHVAELKRDNADLAEDFSRYVQEQLRIASNLGHHLRVQQLLIAATTMAASTVKPAESADPSSSDRIGRLAGLFLFGDPGALRDALLAAPELLADGTPVLAAVLLMTEIDRAALDRDVVRVRELWMARKLLLRCADIGAAEVFGELERGELWPKPGERI